MSVRMDLMDGHNGLATSIFSRRRGLVKMRGCNFIFQIAGKSIFRNIDSVRPFDIQKALQRPRETVLRGSAGRL